MLGSCVHIVQPPLTHLCSRLRDELARLNRNKERREARERQSGKRPAVDAMSPDMMSPGSPMVPMPAAGKQATTRKCANCGQAGHIRKSSFLEGARFDD
jgi:hypothetical protein